MILRNGVLVDEEIEIDYSAKPEEPENEVTRLIKGLSSATTIAQIRDIAKDILESTAERQAE